VARGRAIDFLTLCLVFLARLTGTGELSRLCPLCDRPLVLMPFVCPRVWRLCEDMSVLHAWPLWCSCSIGLPFLIDKVMRLFDWTHSRSFHSTEWGLSSVRTVYYFFLSFEHSSAPLRLYYPQWLSKVCRYLSCIVQVNRHTNHHTTLAEDRTGDKLEITCGTISIVGTE